MEKKIHYFSFYLGENMEKHRQAYPASFTKVEYIKNSIKVAGKKLTLVSTAIAKDGAGYLKRKVIKLDEVETHVYLPTFRYNNRNINKLSTLYMRIQILLYVLFNVKSGDDVLIYHSLAYIQPFNLLRKVKKFNLILEFNDLYHVTNQKLSRFREKEIDFIRSADCYLFMNNIAEKQFKNNKPSILSFGSYQLPNGGVRLDSDGKINVVYAGIIEDTRMAAILAAQSALYLNSKYKIHILGFGTNKHIKMFTELVKTINEKKGYEAVAFHGKLRGQEFSDFMHSCHIGISSHAYTEEEMDSANYTFPSKIPTYIAHDLYVVSPNIPCVVESPFKQFITFYSEHDPIEIATAIKKVSFNNNDNSPSKLIYEMDVKFKEDIKKLLAK